MRQLLYHPHWSQQAVAFVLLAHAPRAGWVPLVLLVLLLFQHVPVVAPWPTTQAALLPGHRALVAPVGNATVRWCYRAATVRVLGATGFRALGCTLRVLSRGPGAEELQDRGGIRAKVVLGRLSRGPCSPGSGAISEFNICCPE